MEFFRKRNFILPGLFLLLLAAVFSYCAADADVISGGSDAPILNWIGPAGAYTAWLLFTLFGLAVYPVLVFLFLGLIRNFFPQKTERKGYIGLLCILTLGWTILFAMYPDYEPWLQNASDLGLGRNYLSAAPSALSGGVAGQFLAAPGVPDEFEAGLIRRYIGDIGTLIVCLFLLIPASLILLYQDYGKLLFQFSGSHGHEERKPETKQAEKETSDQPPFPMTDEEEKVQKPPFWRSLFGKKKEPAQTVPPEEEYHVAPPADAPEAVVFPPDGQTVPAAAPVSSAVLPPQPMPNRRAEAIDTPAGVKPAITQFADNAGADRSRRTEPVQKYSDYELPSVKMLDQHNDAVAEDGAYLEQGRILLQQTLDSFSVEGKVDHIIVGPRVTQYQISLNEGVEISKVARLSGNIAMRMKVQSLRMLAPIPGLDAVGVEVPNEKPSTVYIRSVMESEAWTQNKGAIPIVLGRDVAGNAVVTNLAKAPHMLIAGSTGSGKSVCMNTLIMSLLFKFSPEDLRLILIDPKVVEMAAYQTIPHLITPVVNDPKKAPLALRWGVNEMERRYRQMAKVFVRDLKSFNERPKSAEPVYDDEGKVIPDHLPFLIIIIDELADIMMTEAKKDVETNINRIAAKGRAAGVHLVIATQSPRKDVVTGLIKANLPVKIAFKVGTNMDSRVILDQGGAEKLLGMGDLLFMPPGSATLERIQMTLVTDQEIERIVKFCSQQVEQHFNAEVLAEDVEIQDGQSEQGQGPTAATAKDDEWIDDEPVSAEIVNSAAAKYLQPGDSPLMRQALELIINERQASTSFFQRRLGIGYNKSAELMDQLERRNIVSKPLGGGQKRDILILDGLEIAE